MPYESRTSRKTIRLLSAKIVNSRNFSGILEELHYLPTQSLLNCTFGLFVPLLDVLATLSDSEEWAESGQLPMHNLLLKSISKEPVIVVQVNVRS